MAVDLLCGADNFAGNRAKLGFREVFLAAAGEKQKNKSGACRENPHSAARVQIEAASCCQSYTNLAAFFSTAAPPCNISSAFFTTGSSGEELGAAAGCVRSACAIRSSIEGCTSAVGGTPSAGMSLLPGVK